MFNGWKITNILDVGLCELDTADGPYNKTGYRLEHREDGFAITVGLMEYIYTGAIQHVSKRNVFAMLDWLHEQQAKPRKDLFNPKEVLYDQNRSVNAGL